MSTLFDFCQRLRELNKANKFQETLLLFKREKSNYAASEIGSNKYIVYEMLVALIGMNHYEAVFSFLSSYQTTPDVKGFPYLLKRIKEKSSVPWDFVNRFCDLTEVEKLDTTCMKIEVERKGVMKEMELASAREEWYALKSKALFETGDFEACANLSKEALDRFEKFHYSYDIWFARRVALCKKQTGKPAEALQELLGLLNKKRDWFIQAEVAALYFESGEPDKAMEFALAAVSNFGDLEYKIGLIVLIADILAQKGEDVRAFKHYELSRLLREQEKWSIPSGLMGKIKRYEFPSITAEGLPQLIRELKAFWSRSLPAEKSQGSPSSRQRGTIRRLLHNDSKGIDGFIRSGKEDLYFTIRYDPLISERILVGSIVEFEKKLSVQHNKMNAVNVRICK